MVVVYHQAEGQCCTEYLRVQAGRLGQCPQITIEIGTAHEVYNHVHMRNVILTGLLFAMAFLSAAASKDHDTSVDPPPCSPKMRQAIDTMKSQKSRADIAPPVPLVSPEAEFPDSARKQLRKKAHAVRRQHFGIHGGYGGQSQGCVPDPTGWVRSGCIRRERCKGIQVQPSERSWGPHCVPDHASGQLPVMLRLQIQEPNITTLSIDILF